MNDDDPPIINAKKLTKAEPIDCQLALEEREDIGKYFQGI
jgi:hypothetical protein